MIQLERLAASDFPLLEKVGDGYTPDPQKSVVVVARNDSGIVGRIFLLAPAHVEGIFIEEAWRNGPLMKQLVQAAELEARVEGITQLLVFAKDEMMADYISRLGYKQMPLTVWEKPLCPRH